MTNPARDMQETSKKQCVRSAKKYGMIRLGMSISISAAEHLFEFCDNKDKKWRRQPVYAKLEGKPVTLYYIYHPACTRFEKSLEYLKNQPEL